tara:strand:+ start:259 stop:1215 length:957 start_codon:yes stop_codon:yes gene_type:complete
MPNVNDYLRKKYNLDDVEEVKENAALRNLLTGINQAAYTANRGQDPSAFNASRKANRQMVTDAKQSYVDAEKRDTEEKVRKRNEKLNDPNYVMAIAARKKAREVGINLPDTATLNEIKQAGINPYDLWDKKQARKHEKELESQKQANKIKLANVKSSSTGKRKLGAEETKRRDNISWAIQAITDMDKALVEGGFTFKPTPFTDSNYTLARNQFIEAFARMQTGSAIGAKEDSRFIDMTPRPGDAPEQQRRKLQDLMTEMLKRGADYGLTTDYKLQYGGSETDKPGTKLAGPQTDEDLNNMSEEELVDYTEGRGKYANK